MFAAVAQAATVSVGPSDCSSSAVNSAISSASDGDTVLLTCTGTTSWTSTVTIPSSKGITLQVQNGTNGTWNGGHTARTGVNFPLKIVVSSGATGIVIVANVNKSLVRVSGFDFQNSGTSDPFFKVGGCGNGTANLGAFRIDNNYFDTISAVENVAIWSGQAGGCQGQLWGLIDNNTFHNVYRASDTSYGPYNIQIWNYWHPSGINQCWGCNGWTDNDFAYGSEHEVFIEDNLFEQTADAPGHIRHYISSELGARYVSRYNTFINNFPDSNADLHDAHGVCLVASNGAGARGGEVYHNTIVGTGYDRGTQLRGGSWLVYDNTITSGAGDEIQFDEYRAGDSSMYGQCSSTGNLVLMPPWPVPSGAAWSASAAWKSQAATGGSDYQLPMQIFNTYVWNNRSPGGSVIMPAVDSRGVQSTYIKNGRDYFANADGSEPSGISGYIPYAYPDPLEGHGSDAPVPPTGLTAAVR